MYYFFFQAEDGIRDGHVTGVQTCALPILNEKSYQSLKEVEEEIDIVNVFRRSEHLPAIANEAKDLNIKGFWAQQGVIHEDVPTILEKNDALVMMDLCIKVAHATLVK